MTVARLMVRDVCVKYAGRSVLNGVNIESGAGEIVWVSGPNGVGKSTLLKVCAGVLPPDEGRVTIDGEDVHACDGEGRRQLGYAPEGDTPLPFLTVGEYLKLIARLRSTGPLAADVLDSLELNPLLAAQLGRLSLGERRRTMLAAALVGAPWLLILDEPSNGLTAYGVTVVTKIIRDHVARGGAALVATHDTEFAAEIGGREYQLAPSTG